MDKNYERKSTIAASAVRAFLDHTDAFIFVKDCSGRYVNASEPFAVSKSMLFETAQMCRAA